MSGLLGDSHCTCKYLYIIIFLHQQAFEEAAKRLKMDEEDRKKMVSKRTSFCPVNMFTIWKYLGWHCFELFVAWFCYIYTESEEHPLIRRAWPLFRKWVADNNKAIKQSLQSKDSHCLKKNFPKRGGDGASPSFALAPTVRVTISTLPNLPLS